MKRNNLIYIAIFLILVLLFVYPIECIEAAKNGLLLWFNVIIPTLFPFLLLSYIIIQSPILHVIEWVFTPIFKKLLGLSGHGAFALIMGILSGYPTGAAIVNTLTYTGKISKEEGNYLITFCNNTSPMFMIGFVATGLLNNSHLGLPFLLCIYSANIIVAFLFRGKSRFKSSSHAENKKQKNLSFSFAQFDNWVYKTAEVLVKVGSYIIFLSIPISLLAKLPIKSPIYLYCISLIDLSNGVALLSGLSLTEPIKYGMICSLCAFGSLSVLGQTASVTVESGISTKKYLFAKTINALITFCLTWLYFSLRTFG